MADDEKRVEELNAELEHLLHEVERYRRATEDTLQQLDWCIGYFHGSGKQRIAKSLAQNRAHVRRNLLRRSEMSPPSAETSE
jgi:hypothetical protein